MEVYEPPGAEDCSEILAKWADGHIANIGDLTVAELRELQAAAQHTATKQNLCTYIHNTIDTLKNEEETIQNSNTTLKNQE